jgi:uncharacterized damage-inducible protein DinB
MNREALNELFDYTTFTWESYGKALERLPADAFSRSLPGSGWESMRRLLFHLALGWDGWLRDELGLDDPLDATPESVASWEELQAHRSKVRGWMRQILDESDGRALSEPETAMRRENPASTPASRADILTHILLHERGHHGDVATALSALGVEAPMSDYMVYLFFKRRAAPP